MPLVNVRDPRRGVLTPAYLARRRAAFQNVNAMLARSRGLRGLGTVFVTGIPDSPTCGANPCGFFDAFGPSAACLTFVRCADPTEFSSWLTGNGQLLPSLGAQIGSDVGGTVGGTVNSTVDSFVNSVFGPGNPSSPTSSGVNWLVVGGIALGVLLLPRLLKG